MDVGERLYDLGADPVKGTAKGAWGGMKKGAITLGIVAVAGTLLIFGLGTGALVGALGAGIVGYMVGVPLGAAAGGATGGVEGTFSGIKKFLVGRDKSLDPRTIQLEALRQQAAAEEAQTNALRMQQQRAAAMDGANPDASTNNAAKVAAARQAEAAAVATGQRSPT